MAVAAHRSFLVCHGTSAAPDAGVAEGLLGEGRRGKPSAEYNRRHRQPPVRAVTTSYTTLLESIGWGSTGSAAAPAARVQTPQGTSQLAHRPRRFPHLAPDPCADRRGRALGAHACARDLRAERPRRTGLPSLSADGDAQPPSNQEQVPRRAWCSQPSMTVRWSTASSLANRSAASGPLRSNTPVAARCTSFTGRTRRLGRWRPPVRTASFESARHPTATR